MVKEAEKTSGVKNRGFASMIPERRREIASKGGKSVKPENRAYSRDKDLAARAGRKGGLVLREDKKA